MKVTVVHVILVLLVCSILLVLPTTAVSVNPVQITVTIQRVHQLNEPDIDGCCSDADFYAGVKIGDNGYQETSVYDEDTADISPNWQIGQSIFLEDIGDGIPIYIQMWDDDSPYSDDDPIDINPDPNYQILLIYFNPFTGKWHGYTDTGYARGDNGDQADIGLRSNLTWGRIPIRTGFPIRSR